MNFIVHIRSIYGQVGRGSKIVKNCGHHILKVPYTFGPLCFISSRLRVGSGATECGVMRKKKEGGKNEKKSGSQSGDGGINCVSPSL